jgi:hypothetical protein
VVSCRPLLLNPLEKSSGHLLDRRLGGPHRQSERFEENNLALPGIESGASSQSLYYPIKVINKSYKTVYVKTQKFE